MTERKILMTGENGPRLSERPYDAPVPGPMAGTEISPLQFIASNATPEELKAFERTIRDRVAKEPREIFEICMNPKCGYVSSRGPRKKPGRACWKCNFQDEVGGGTYRDMIPAEVKAYQAREAAREAAARARTERAEFNHDCDDRRTRGLVPLTLEEFRARHRAEAEERAKERREYLERENRELMNLARKLTKDLPR